MAYNDFDLHPADHFDDVSGYDTSHDIHLEFEGAQYESQNGNHKVYDVLRQTDMETGER